MIKLYDNSIFVGEIKQLLHNFNLPLIQVGNRYPKANSSYILNNNIFQWVSDNTGNIVSTKRLGSYDFGCKYLNVTSNFEIKNLVYDIETHKYLGKYLRFIRDYTGIDLMSMYNCFCEETSDYNISFDIGSGDDLKKVLMNSGNGYVAYKIPVSINTLTISTHNITSCEMCLYVDDVSLTGSDKNNIAKSTYIKTKINNFIHINLFEKSNEKSTLTKFYDKIYLLLKVPSSLKTSITVLDGKYYIKDNSDYICYKPCLSIVEGEEAILQAIRKATSPVSQYPYDYDNLKEAEDKYLTVAVETNEEIYSDTAVDTGFNVTSQLLSPENLSGNYLLADRLIEYLTGNAINPLSQYYDIRKLQSALSEKETGLWENSLDQKIKNIIKNSGYDFGYDSVGYLDKDVETYIKEDLDR